jgi:hypothetical protein
MLGDGIPDLRDEIPKIVAAIRGRLGRDDVVLTPDPPTDESVPPLQPRKVFVYGDKSRSRVVEGATLLVTARCDDPTSWPLINSAFGAEGFDPYGDSKTVGTTKSQCFASRTRASFVAPQNPDARMAVDKVGRSALGWIVPEEPGEPVYAHRPRMPPRQ